MNWDSEARKEFVRWDGDDGMDDVFNNVYQGSCLSSGRFRTYSHVNCSVRMQLLFSNSGDTPLRVCQCKHSFPLLLLPFVLENLRYPSSVFVTPRVLVLTIPVLLNERTNDDELFPNYLRSTYRSYSSEFFSLHTI